MGHLASPVSECRLTCGGEVGLAIACLTMGAEVGSAWVEEAAAADLDLTAGGRVSRHSQTYRRHGGPCANARRLEQTTAGRQRVALGWWECAAGG